LFVSTTKYANILRTNHERIVENGKMRVNEWKGKVEHGNP